MVAIDTGKQGLYAIFKKWEVPLFEKLLSEDIEMNSNKAHQFILTQPITRSRAAIIFALNDAVDEGILKYRETTGKGGHHRVYRRALTMDQLWQKVSQELKKFEPLKRYLAEPVL